MDNTESENLYLESPKAFNLEMPLYSDFDLSNKNVAKKVYKCISDNSTIDAYCIWCDKESVFKTKEYIYETPISNGPFSGVPSETPLKAWMDRGDGIGRVVHSCVRVPEHKYYAYYYKLKNLFTKIGQYPSGADFQIPQAAKYRKVLGDDQYKEFTKGIGLAAHGVGIGSFVYLRRIFENLIADAHILEFSKGSFDQEAYTKAHMDEKIEILKEQLPDFLVENKKLYSILSVGIHSLKEEDCLNYFESVKIGIEQILDEKIERLEKTKKAEKARAAVQKVLGQISG